MAKSPEPAEPPEPEPVEPEADIVWLRAPDGKMVPALDEPAEVAVRGRAEARKSAAERRAAFEWTKQAALIRAGQFPRTDLAVLGYGLAGYLMSLVMSGQLQPSSPKEAMEVAKQAHEIAQKVTGRSTADGPMSPAERNSTLNSIDSLMRELEKRVEPDAPDEVREPDGS